MDEDHAAPASKADSQFGGHAPPSKTLDLEKIAPSSAKRKRDNGDVRECKTPDDRNEHGNKGTNKYKQRTFQHGSRKHKGDKRKDMGREEYLYVTEYIATSSPSHSPPPYLVCSTN